MLKDGRKLVIFQPEMCIWPFCDLDLCPLRTISAVATHMAVIRSGLRRLYRTRSVTREEKNLSNFLKRPADKWVENSFEVSQCSVVSYRT